MNVCDVMTAHPSIILSEASIAEALRLMRWIGCHHLPVISVEKHLTGVLSFHDCQRVLGDLLSSDVLSGNDPVLNMPQANTIPVAHVMTPAPIIVEPDAPAVEAARLMLEYGIGCLPVMRGETLVGIVTRSDLLIAFMHQHQKSIPPLEA